MLPKGGIVIHLKSEEDTLSLEEDINKIYPGSTCSIPQSIKRYRKVVIKNIHQNIGVQDLTIDIQKTYLEKVQIKRFLSSFNQKPLPIVSISCKDSLCDKLLSQGINVLGSH